MADQKVSDLPSLNGADVDAADLLYIVDSSAGAAGSKKITIGQYQLAPVSGGTANTVVYLNGSKVESSSSALTFDGTNFATTGTSSAAKLIPTGGTATGNGMYLPAANTLAWSNNGAETMRLDASGNLGLGVTPSFRLDASIDNPTRGIVQRIRNGASATQTGAQIQFTQNGIADWVIGQPAATNVFAIWSGRNSAADGTQAMTLHASGGLSVGNTLDPGAKSFNLGFQNGVGNLVGAFNFTGYIAGYGAGIASYVPTGSPGVDYQDLRFYTSAGPSFINTERARITSGGDLLVGTTSNSINGNVGSGVTSSNTTSGSGVFFVYNSATSGADSAPGIAIQKAMTTTTSSARFMQFYANGTGTPMGGIVGNGASNVQFATISDAREKTNIQPISGSLGKVVALRPVSFDWIKSGEHVNAGFVAQEVEQVFPEFVVENMANDGEEPRKGLTGGMTGGIVAHLVAAIKEQQALIEDLRARVAALEAK